MENTITLPQKTVFNLFDRLEEVRSFQDELEDYVMMNDPQVIEKLKRAREDDLAGATKPFSELLNKYV